MCNPAAIAAMQVAGTVGSAVGAAGEGKAQQSYYNYLAAQNEAQTVNVTKAADTNVGLVSGAAAREDVNLSRDVAVTEGAQRAASSASGVWGGSKTREDIATDTANKAALDRAAIRTNADLQSQKITTEAANETAALRNQAGSFRMAGENARRTGNINATTSVLNGATNVASRWYQWKQLKGDSTV
jgi:hypothetical protein